MEFTFAAECGFFNSINGDRKYVAEQMNEPYHRLVSNGVFATPAGTPSTDLQVLSQGSGMSVGIMSGSAIFGDKWFRNPRKQIFSVAANTTMLPRRDSIIAQVNRTDAVRAGRLIYRTGEPSSNPMPPDLSTDNDIKEYRIANIYVASGATTINQDAIVDLRGSSECPWVTSLIKQVDTSTLFLQWQAAYENYYNSATEGFGDWMDAEKMSFETWLAGLTEQLTVATSVVKYESQFTTSATSTTVIPINIASFNKDKDVLMVRINNLFAVLGEDYTIAANNASITLTKPLPAGQDVAFLVLQSVVVGDTTAVMAALTAINAKVTDLAGDSGWVTLGLGSGIKAFDSTTVPAARKFGSQIYIRGAVKGVRAAPKVICMLPSNMVPTVNHQFTSSAFLDGTISTSVVIEVQNTGHVVAVAVSGSNPSAKMLPIATSFCIG